MFCEPLNGWRAISVRPRRTKVDWAQEMAHLLRTRYRDAQKVILICDSLNTHTRDALCEDFPTKEATELVTRFEFSYTPKHGRWLNVSENELSALTRQCLKDRKVGNLEALREETKAWVQLSEWESTRG